MDRTIQACCGWQELDTGHSFSLNERGQTRFTISPAARREILHRLFPLNLQIAAGVKARGWDACDGAIAGCRNDVDIVGLILRSARS